MNKKEKGKGLEDPEREVPMLKPSIGEVTPITSHLKEAEKTDMNKSATTEMELDDRGRDDQDVTGEGQGKGIEEREEMIVEQETRVEGIKETEVAAVTTIQNVEKGSKKIKTYRKSRNPLQEIDQNSMNWEGSGKRKVRQGEQNEEAEEEDKRCEKKNKREVNETSLIEKSEVVEARPNWSSRDQ